MTALHFTSPPEDKFNYRVGDRVKVKCDHDDAEGNRVHGWIVGVVAQVDVKMIAVQFQQNVYLTDGWMVPDRVLWCPKNSSSVRLYTGEPHRKRRSSLTDIP
ncbi:MAG: hypothetical protein Fur0018_04070 [Anaerolineales bacterium]